MTQRETKTSTKETKPARAPKVNVLDDQGSEEEAPNAAFTAALELARQATSAPPQTAPSQEPPPPVNQPASKPEKQKPDRAGAGYTKATHRIRDDAFQALEDMKLLLKRKYGFKRILLEEIVEEAILGIKRDLDEQKEQSILVQRLREPKLPENQ
jgi:hypothetical protein